MLYGPPSRSRRLPRSAGSATPPPLRQGRASAASVLKVRAVPLGSCVNRPGPPVAPGALGAAGRAGGLGGGPGFGAPRRWPRSVPVLAPVPSVVAGAPLRSHRAEATAARTPATLRPRAQTRPPPPSRPPAPAAYRGHPSRGGNRRSAADAWPSSYISRPVRIVGSWPAAAFVGASGRECARGAKGAASIAVVGVMTCAPFPPCCACMGPVSPSAPP